MHGFLKKYKVWFRNNKDRIHAMLTSSTPAVGSDAYPCPSSNSSSDELELEDSSSYGLNKRMYNSHFENTNTLSSFTLILCKPSVPSR